VSTAEVLVYLGEDSPLYRQLLKDSNHVHYVFCETADEVERSIDVADIVYCVPSFPAHLLKRGKKIRWIQLLAAGVDRLVPAVRELEGVLLTRSDVTYGDRIAEYVLARCLADAQRLRELDMKQRDAVWEPVTVHWLKGQTMGIAGVGSIGRVIADRARGMHMHVVGYAYTSREVAGFDHVYPGDQLPAFLSELDVLVLALPLTSATKGLISGDEFEIMKPSVLLVNVARGAIVDEAALIAALSEGRIRAAALDVFETEPLPKTSPLWQMRNVTVSAHFSGSDVPEELAEFFLDNLGRFIRGDTLQGTVDLTRGY
jgi:phosphoglycerate dehydrogenase-like enzyme